MGRLALTVSVVWVTLLGAALITREPNLAFAAAPVGLGGWLLWLFAGRSK